MFPYTFDMKIQLNFWALGRSLPALKVPMREIFHLMDFHYFYTIKPLLLGDFRTKRNKNIFYFCGSLRGEEFLRRNIKLHQIRGAGKRNILKHAVWIHYFPFRISLILIYLPGKKVKLHASVLTVTKIWSFLLTFVLLWKHYNMIDIAKY